MTLVKKKGQPAQGICALCGRRGKVTRDHIPPKCLFGKKGCLPSDLITIPACDTCNLKTSRDDEYLRFVMAGRADVAGHPVADSLRDSIVRSLGRPEARAFARSFIESLATVDAFTDGGIYLGPRIGFRRDYARVEAAIKKIIRGLFFHEYGRRLRCSDEVLLLDAERLRRVMPHDDFEVWRYQVRGLLVGGRERSIGDKTLLYRCNQRPGHVFQTIWTLTFYGNVHFIAFTEAAKQVAGIASRRASHNTP